MRVQDNIDAGLTEKEAWLDAMRRFGNLGVIKENTRSVRVAAWLETVLQDLRFGWRTLRRSPGFATVAVLTIAFSIGATTTVVTMVDSVLLRPLPYQEPERLISANIYIPTGGFSAVPGADLVAWQEQARSFDAIAGFAGASRTLTETGDPMRVMAARVTSNFLPLLGAAPRIGRIFSVDDDRPHAEFVALMSHGLWQERFGADPQIVGKRISLDGARYTVIGVLSAGFRFPSPQLEPDILVPLQLSRFGTGQITESHNQAKDDNFVLLEGSIARLKPAMSLPAAGAELAGISRQVYDQYPLGYRNFLKGRRVEVASLRQSLVGKVRRPLLIMLAAVGLVLLIGCLNIASLQLARGVERGGELSVRAALGARQGRLLRQLVTENILLSCVGGLLGVALAVGRFRYFEPAPLAPSPPLPPCAWICG
jgi:putative ABC transport system permease protein